MRQRATIGSSPRHLEPGQDPPPDPAQPARVRHGGGRRTLSNDQITSRYDAALTTNTHDAPHLGEHRGADDRADHPRAVHLRRVERDGAGQVLRGRRAPAAARCRSDRTPPGPCRSGTRCRPARPATGRRTVATHASARDSRPWSTDTVTRSRRRSKASASSPPTSENSSSGPSWANSSTPTKRRRLGEVVGERAEDDVLHPAADVRQERADEHPPEHAVAQRGAGRAGADGAVAVLQRVDGVLDGLSAESGGRGSGAMLVRSIPSTAERGRARTLTRRGDRVRGAGAPVRRGRRTRRRRAWSPVTRWARSRAARCAAASYAPSTPTTAAACGWRDSCCD